jgi:ubiquinone/menaquinone biosynthesis C-methylase UbiE
MISSTQRFSSRVEYYVKARPKYPNAMLRFFQNDLGLSPIHSIADVGSGTGFLTELFVRNGNLTYAVEPNAPMREAAEVYLKDWQNFHSVDGTAEATTLADHSIDFVTAGQAFHWFNPELAAKEFQRILKPGGLVALIWNERLTDASPFMQQFHQLIETYRDKGELGRARLGDNVNTENIRQFFGASGFKIAKFENPQTLDREGLIDRIVSSSYMPLPSDPRYEDLLKEAKSLFDVHQQSQTVQILHETRLYYGKIR